MLLDPVNGAHLGLPSFTRYVEGSLRFSRYTSRAYALHEWLVSYCCRGQLAVRVGARSYERFFGTSDSKYYSLDDRRCGMGDVAFYTAPPIGGFCFV